MPAHCSSPCRCSASCLCSCWPRHGASPGADRKPWFSLFFKISRYYVFVVLILANLWLLAAALVINTDFWSLYDPSADADPSAALEEALQHWDELQ